MFKGIPVINYSNRVSNTPLAFISIGLHCYALIVFGAVFWIDSTAYISLGQAIIQENGLKYFYTGVGTWFYSHLQPGLPLLWLALENLPPNLHWPILAVFQHSLGALALYYFFSTLNANWPSRWNYLGCGLVAFLPFYQAAHNSLMTESISSSLMLIGLSLVLRMKNDTTLDRVKLSILFTIILLVTQFRSYFGILLFGTSLISLYKFNIAYFRTSLILAIGLTISVMAFPTYRYVETGVFWLPNLGMNKLQTGWRVNPRPTNETLQKLERFDFPANLSPNTRIDKGLDYNEASEIALHWRKNGLTDQEINRRALDAGELLTNDSTWVFINRGLFALTSSGLVLPYCYLNPNTIVFPRYSAKMLCDHIVSTYSFQSWLSADNPTVIFDRFFHHDNSKETFQEPFQEFSSLSIYSDTRQYINKSSSWQKDPINIGKIAPDWLIIFSIVSMAFANRQQRVFSLICAWLIIGNFCVNYLAPLGNPRYGYFLFPIYVAFAFLGISQITSWLRAKLFL